MTIPFTFDQKMFTRYTLFSFIEAKSYQNVWWLTSPKHFTPLGVVSLFQKHSCSVFWHSSITPWRGNGNYSTSDPVFLWIFYQSLFLKSHKHKDVLAFFLCYRGLQKFPVGCLQLKIFRNNDAMENLAHLSEGRRFFLVVTTSLLIFCV